MLFGKCKNKNKNIIVNELRLSMINRAPTTPGFKRVLNRIEKGEQKIARKRNMEKVGRKPSATTAVMKINHFYE